MTVYESNTSRSIGTSSIFAPATWMRGAVVIVKWWEARKQMRHLHGMDDRLLKDIGLRRSDLDWALMQRTFTDPTEALQVRRNENRWAAKKAAHLARKTSR